MEPLIKLNLGCGQNPIPGFVNVDKYGNPDVRHDLETFPWPWPDNSVQLVILNHCLEHLGETVGLYFRIFQEMYRICAPQAVINIAVPHPRHDDFLNDPTHMRCITPNGLRLFSKKLNEHWQNNNCANSPLGLFLNIDYDLESYSYRLDPEWRQKLKNGECNEADIQKAARRYLNVIKEIRMRLKVIK